MKDRTSAETGFVLVTTLVILVILTLMMTGLFYRARANQETSVSDRDFTQGFYLAEAGLNYVTWALYSDPDHSWQNNDVSLDGDSTPDNREILNNPDQVANHTLGYFDINNTMNFNPASPHGVALSSLSLPPHVALDITVNANNTPSVVAEPWNNGASKPSGNGVVVWVVPAVLDPSGDPMNEKDTASTRSSYDLFAYCIAYVHGHPIKMIRAKIGSMVFGFPSNIGATTNSYQ